MSESRWKMAHGDVCQLLVRPKGDLDSILLKIEVQPGRRPGLWLVFCDVPSGWIGLNEVVAESIDDAKRQAVEIVKAKLQEAMDALNSAS